MEEACGREALRRPERGAESQRVETSAGNKIYLEASRYLPFVSTYTKRHPGGDPGEKKKKKPKRNIDRRVEEPSSSEDVPVSIVHVERARARARPSTGFY